MSVFHNREDAGKKLGALLKEHHLLNPVILALPRGGIVVADEVAKSLGTGLGVVIARKIGAPGHPEFGIGAISEDEVPSFNPVSLSYIDKDSPLVSKIVADETIELRRRIESYRGGHSLPEMKGKSVIVVDDGLATGVTAVAAAKFLRRLHPRELILAVPVGPKDVGVEVRSSYDKIICLHSPDDLRSVGLWYEDFNQVEDSEVLTILKHYH